MSRRIRSLSLPVRRSRSKFFAGFRTPRLTRRRWSCNSAGASRCPRLFCAASMSTRCFGARGKRGETLPGVALGKHVAGDDDLLDLAGAIVDLGHLGVAKVAFDVVALQVATAAENLDGARRVLHAVVAAEHLGHGRFL